MFLVALRGCPGYSGLLCGCLHGLPSFLLPQPSCPDSPCESSPYPRAAAASLLTLPSPTILPCTVGSKSPLKEQTSSLFSFILQSLRSPLSTRITAQGGAKDPCWPEEEHHSFCHSHREREGVLFVCLSVFGFLKSLSAVNVGLEGLLITWIQPYLKLQRF